MPEIFLQNENARLWTCTSGQGTLVMLCNGGPECCDYLGSVAALMDDMAKVIRFEQQ